ncbi:EAL domain-containing protein [Ureibacillus massiliensis]|uniref:EAL domain-containing protein n=1 Tax=Ureibacillus massiliensis TaxID=292806 RepID=UPI0006912881|nr:EAL domain-containing protein [Ureibacillus massiliensis]
MTTKPLNSKNDALFQTLKSIGNQSKKSYVILELVNKQLKICYCNEQLYNITRYTSNDLINKSFETLFSNENSSVLKQVEENIHKGELFKEDLLLNIFLDTPILVDVTIIPLQLEKGEGLLSLLIINEFSHNHLEQILHHIEEQIYKAIEHESTLVKKLQIVCEGIEELLNGRTVSKIYIRENNNHKQLQMVMAQKYGLEEPYIFRRRADIQYLNNLIDQAELNMYENIDYHRLDECTRKVIEEKGLTKYCTVPIENHVNNRIGMIVIYFDSIVFDHLERYKAFLHKINNLISLAYIYDQKLREISFLAYNDVSTGIPNRLGFMESLKELEQKQIYGLIHIIEPSEFAEVVELYGREAGDELLNQLCRKLKMLRRKEEDFIARFSSSKIIAFTHHKKGEKIVDFNRISETLVEVPFIIQNNPVYITLKCGIAPFNEEIPYKDSIRFAENAFSEAKHRAGNVLVSFKGDMDGKLKKNLLISSLLTKAVKNSEIEVYFQPKVNLKDGSISSIEALARWNSPTLGFISPFEFMPVAEKTGLVREIDLQVIEKVLQWFSLREEKRKPIVPIAVNISPDHFYHPRFVDQLVELVKKYNANPCNIIIEITENMSLVDLTKARRIIRELKFWGFRTSVDDFGMGYSSLNYLQELSFAELKIDRNFTMKIHEKGTYAIVKAIIQIAQALNIDTVAEGVETEEQARTLKELGCDTGQGYLFYKPISMKEFEENIEL